MRAELERALRAWRRVQPVRAQSSWRIAPFCAFVPSAYLAAIAFVTALRSDIDNPIAGSLPPDHATGEADIAG
jgi:hypothetical protein